MFCTKNQGWCCKHAPGQWGPSPTEGTRPLWRRAVVSGSLGVHIRGSGNRSRGDDVMTRLSQCPPSQAEAAGTPQGPCWPLPIRARGSWLPRGWGLGRGGDTHTVYTPTPSVEGTVSSLTFRGRQKLISPPKHQLGGKSLSLASLQISPG